MKELSLSITPEQDTLAAFRVGVPIVCLLTRVTRWALDGPGISDPAVSGTFPCGSLFHQTAPLTLPWWNRIPGLSPGYRAEIAHSGVARRWVSHKSECGIPS